MQLSDVIGRLPEKGTGPLYMQLQRLLREAIGGGVLKPDEALPSERDMCEDLGLSRITIRKAITGLVDEQLLFRRHGAGTFVSGASKGSRVEKVFSKLSSFSEDMRSREMEPSSQWLERTTAMVSPEEAMALGLSPGSSVYRFRRIRLANAEPMALEYSVVPARLIKDAEHVGESLYEALQQAGNRPVRALQRLRAVAFDAEVAAALHVDPGAPGLLIERRGYLADGQPVEFTQSYYRGDVYDFVAELSDF